ncbi:hypothetical protein ACNF49_29620 [Actinomadura sp. ATCC 39365]
MQTTSRIRADDFGNRHPITTGAGKRGAYPSIKMLTAVAADFKDRRRATAT